MGCTERDVSVVFVSDRRIRELNRDYRHIDAPTDVLSFPTSEGEMVFPDDPSLGDVVISVETAARQAEEAGLTLDAEINRLLIHGLLHLLGFDHQNPDETRKMRERERRLLKKLTV